MMTLSNELRQRGQEVSFLTFKGRGLGDHVNQLGFESAEVRVRTKVDPLAVIAMSRAIRQARADIVHCHLSTSAVNGALAAKMAGVPGVSTVHGLSGKLSFKPSYHLIAVSAEVRRHMVLQGIHESKISIVPNGIELQDWSPNDRLEARRALGIALDVPVLGTTARLTQLKGVNQALYAVARVKVDFPNVRYVVFGDGEQRKELADLSRSLGIEENVVWLGYRNDVPKLLPALDLFLFPSLREAMGISIVEAMAACVPAVATTIGGIPEVVTPETGVLVPPSDPIAMADAIVGYLRDPEKRLSAGQAAWERAHTEFSASRMAARTLGVYADVLDRYGRV